MGGISKVERLGYVMFTESPRDGLKLGEGAGEDSMDEGRVREGMGY